MSNGAAFLTVYANVVFIQRIEMNRVRVCRPLRRYTPSIKQATCV